MSDPSAPVKEEAKRRVSLGELKSSSRIFRYVLPYKTNLIIGLVFLVISSVSVLAFPYLFGKLMDAAQGKSTGIFQNIDTVTLMIVGILIIMGITSYARVMFFARLTEFSIADIRQDLYDKIITLPIPFFDNRRTGELISRITSDVSQLQDTLSLTLAEFLRQSAVLILGIPFILYTTLKLTLLMLATYPVVIIIAISYARFIKKLSRKTQDELANSNVVVEETFQSINTVKAFTNEYFESKRFNSSIQKVVDLAIKTARYRGLLITFVIIGLLGGIILVLWYGAHLVFAGKMSYGVLTSFILYTVFIGGSIGGLGDSYTKILKTIGASERLLDILSEDSEIEISETKRVERPESLIKGRVAFKNIVFSYPTRKDAIVLKNISFTIHKGEKIALVGPSGAGKSTITQLLLGFYHPDSGTIEIDDQPIDQFELPVLRGNFGIVPQEVILFGGTIRENILYGKPNANETEVLDAARKANALEFIETFPDKFETMVGERGVKLSGGQKQRIAIARAILKDPSILILDEATSSLDSASEVLVQQALEELMKNRTTIIIAHRLSTIRKVDKILVLNHGKIVEQGTHDELLQNKDGLYNHLISLQFDLATNNA